MSCRLHLPVPPERYRDALRSSAKCSLSSDIFLQTSRASVLSGDTQPSSISCSPSSTSRRSCSFGLVLRLSDPFTETSLCAKVTFALLTICVQAGQPG
eukprot:1925088-Amphidinium_carterae.1